MRMMDDRSVLISHHYNGDEFGKPVNEEKMVRSLECGTYVSNYKLWCYLAYQNK